MSDNWDFYSCTVENKHASIYLDMGIAGQAPAKTLPQLSYISIKMNSPKENGLSSNDEFEVLCKIEDLFEDKLTAHDGLIEYVGRNTTDGCRDFYFYTSAGFEIETFANDAMSNFPDYRYFSESREDKNWEVYSDFLYPTDYDYQSIMNRRVYYSLQGSGDKPEVEREICHWMYLSSEKNREQLKRILENRSYVIKSEHKTEDECDNPYVMIVAHNGKTDLNSIDDSVYALYELAGEYQASYDGWETSVEK